MRKRESSRGFTLVDFREARRRGRLLNIQTRTPLSGYTPSIVGAVYYWDPKREQNFNNHLHEVADLRALDFSVEESKRALRASERLTGFRFPNWHGLPKVQRRILNIDRLQVRVKPARSPCNIEEDSFAENVLPPQVWMLRWVNWFQHGLYLRFRSKAPSLSRKVQEMNKTPNRKRSSMLLEAAATCCKTERVLVGLIIK